MKLADEPLVFAIAHDRTNVAGTDKALHPIAWRTQEGSDGRRDQNMRGEHREVGKRLPFWLAKSPLHLPELSFQIRRQKKHIPIGLARANFNASVGKSATLTRRLALT